MDERVMQFRVGVMVVATLIITAILVLLFGEVPSLSLLHRTYSIQIKLPEAPGITRDTPIRKSGIRIGRVSKVVFDDDDTGVLLTADISADRRIYHNEICRANSSLLGDASLEFVRVSDPGLPATLIEKDEIIKGVVIEDPSRAITNLQEGLSQTIKSVDTASHALESVLKKIDGLLGDNDKNISKVIGQADETLQIVQKTLTNANDILGDAKTRAQFKESMQEMPEILRGTRETIDRMGGSIKLLESNLGNIEGLTKPLGERGEGLVIRIDNTTKKLDQVMNEMLKFSQDLNNPQGSVGQLVHNPELYQRLNRAAKNIDELTRQLQPIMDDARVFSDKIARHPESLGVRGALQRNPGVK